MIKLTEANEALKSVYLNEVNKVLDNGPYKQTWNSKVVLQNTGFIKPKIGRNKPCPCGSGLKFKNCCLNKEVKL